MKGQSNGGRGVCSPDRGGGGVHDKRGAHNNTNGKNGGCGGSGSSETAHDSKTSPVNEIPIVWPPKFAIGLTNKEKEEDFLAIKGSKLPNRPKKRAKFIQRTINVRISFFYFSLFIISFFFGGNWNYFLGVLDGY